MRPLLRLLAAVIFVGSPVSALEMIVDSRDDTADAVPGDAVCDDGDGRCTLRAALQEAALNLGHEVITFSLLGAGVRTIRLTGPLPDISEHDGVTLDGRTQSGYEGSPLIEIDGAAVAGDCLRVTAGHSNVYALNIHSCGGSGLVLRGGHLITVEGCYLGTDPTGTIALGNGAHGLAILDASDIRVGGTALEQGNVASGNGGHGILVAGGDAFAVELRGNSVGINSAGNGALANGGNGITIDRGHANTIGGPAIGARNLLSGNGMYGIVITGDGAVGNVVWGNSIGVGLRVSSAVGNFVGVRVEATGNRIVDNLIASNAGAGVIISGAAARGTELIGNTIGGGAAEANGGDGIMIEGDARGTLIGGLAATEGNLISANGGSGVRVSGGDDTAIRGNSIFGNAIIAIDLGGDAGVTLNDPLDADLGANGLQNFPELMGASSDCTGTTVDGRLEATAATVHELDFYANDGCSAHGFGPAMRYLGSMTVTTSPAGTVTFSAALPSVVAAGTAITATATRTASAGGGATSELAACVAASQSCFTCGDHATDPGEECDEGGVDTLACDLDCSFARCGDRHVNGAAGEQCDDGNTTAGDGCDPECGLETCETGSLVRLAQLVAVATDADRVELTWEVDPEASAYHLNSVADKFALSDPTRAPGNGRPECDVAPPATRCEVSSAAGSVLYQVLSACGPAGVDEGPF